MPHRMNIQQYYFKDTAFASLMNKRIYNILLIATRYDAFMLEDDGRVDEQIFNEYVSLNLRYPPRFTQVTNEKDALEELRHNTYELIISMPSGINSDAFELASKIKNLYRDIPIVVLTPFSRQVSVKLENEDLSAIDYVFSWLGNADLLLAIIKLIEDRMNVENDVSSVGVETILVVEDSVRFYSSILPYIYKFVLKQSQIFSTEALNEHQRTLRMRGRPKILLARSYEEALSLYTHYQDHTLGIISDISYNMEGIKATGAGFRLVEKVRERDPFIPIILQSSEISNRDRAVEMGCSFIHKDSKTMPQELRRLIYDDFGFGDFIFRNPITQQEVGRATNLKSLQHLVMTIPADSMLYHQSRNHLSKWLYSRAMFPLAEFIRAFKVDKIEEVEPGRKVLFDAIINYRRMKNRGVVAEFQRDRFDQYSNFARIGEGSLGGKGRGLAFIDAMIKRHPELEQYENLEVTIPRTVVLCTDIFDEFMESNSLYSIALSDIPDEKMLYYFLRSKLPERLIEDFMALFDVVETPIAIRSSSLLEDSHYQPFAGIYSTYMIPKVSDKYEMLRMVSDAIKGVYASVFFADSKAYMTATHNVIDQEKMSIILQEVCGTAYGDSFYPTFSGVGRSLNYYPIGPEQPEDGIVNIAMGLGKYIVDGGQTLRFSPKHPHHILQTSSVDFALGETQTKFYALDLSNKQFQVKTDDAFNLLIRPTREAESDGSMQYICSTFDPYDMMIRDGFYPQGRKLITFANILQHDVIPLAATLDNALHLAATDMGREVEIEFCVNMDTTGKRRGVLYLLQVRPIVDNKEVLKEDISQIQPEQLILQSSNALGNGVIDDVMDIVYVKPEEFSASNNQLIAYEIEKINKRFLTDGGNYILIGPGRWGSSDTWLGIPVKWPHISAARLIVEAGLERYRIDPSQGTHFFQNLTSFGVGYFTINAFVKEGIYDIDYLNSLPAHHESAFVRWVKLPTAALIKIDGKKNLGVVLKPLE